MRNSFGGSERPLTMHERLIVFRHTASCVLPLLLSAISQCISQVSAASVESPSISPFEYLLSTATVTLYPCASLAFLSPVMAPCPAASPPNSASAIASIVACSAEEDVSLGVRDALVPLIGTNELCPEPPTDASCRVAYCACEDDDDDDCVECAAHRSNDFTCTSTTVQVANHSLCVKLTSHIPAHMLSSKMAHAAGHYNQAFDRIIFKLQVFNQSTSSPAITPPLGPWLFSSFHRWHLAHSSEDDHLAAIDARYRLVALGSQWPDAKCLDGTKGAYYMCVIQSSVGSIHQCNTLCIMPARSEASRFKWRVFLEGGGWCTGDNDCALRSKVRAPVCTLS